MQRTIRATHLVNPYNLAGGGKTGEGRLSRRHPLANQRLHIGGHGRNRRGIPNLRIGGQGGFQRGPAGVSVWIGVQCAL